MKFLHHCVLIAALCAVGLCSCSSRVVYESPKQNTAVAQIVNINTASVDELQRLPHIGRKTAEAIVAFREANGPYRRAEDLMLIRGISETRFAGLREYIKTE